jgi:hypothetical protein
VTEHEGAGPLKGGGDHEIPLLASSVCCDLAYCGPFRDSYIHTVMGCGIGCRMEPMPIQQCG